MPTSVKGCSIPQYAIHKTKATAALPCPGHSQRMGHRHPYRNAKHAWVLISWGTDAHGPPDTLVIHKIGARSTLHDVHE